MKAFGIDLEVKYVDDPSAWPVKVMCELDGEVFKFSDRPNITLALGDIIVGKRMNRKSLFSLYIEEKEVH